MPRGYIIVALGLRDPLTLDLQDQFLNVLQQFKDG